MDQVNPLTLDVPNAGNLSVDIPKVDRPNYTPEETQFRSNLIARLMQMRFMRDRNHPELDNMTYVEYYEANRRKDLSYLIPKKNRQDIRIVTGTTREKDSTLLSTMLDLNLNPAITAFDVDDMIVNEFGENMSDMVKKSREIEEYEEIRGIIYREMIAQGDVFVQELHVEEFRDIPLKKDDWDPTISAVSEYTIKRRLQKVFDGCRVRMVNGKKVYLGNIRCENIKNQPIVAILNVYPRSTTSGIYGQWERWKNVPYKMDTADAFWDDGKTYKDWNLVQLSDYDKVAEIMVFDPVLNLFQIFLNGIMMLPANYPLTSISPSGEIPMSQGKLEPISDFCYSKSQPSKTKVDQEVKDEIVKLMIERMRLGNKPPLGNNGSTILSDKVYMAGQITPNIKDGELFPILPNFAAGISPGDFSFYKLISDSIDEKTVNKGFQGQDQSGDQTATQAVQDKNQQMLKLGLSIDGLVNLERRMTWLRIYNIIEHWMDEDDSTLKTVRKGVKDAYKTISVETSLEDGSSGIKMFRFSPNSKFPNVGDQHQEEEHLSKSHGKPVRIVYMDPAAIRAMKWRWYVIMNPSPKSNDKLSQIMFTQNITEGYGLFGPQAFNQDYLKQRWASNIKENYSKMFVKSPLGMGPAMGGPQAPGMGAGGPMAPGAPGANGGRQVTPGMAAGGPVAKAMMGQ